MLQVVVALALICHIGVVYASPGACVVDYQEALAQEIYSGVDQLIVTAVSSITTYANQAKMFRSSSKLKASALASKLRLTCG